MPAEPGCAAPALRPAEPPSGAAARPAPAWRLRACGPVNWWGLWAHSWRGVMSFFADGVAYVCGPLVTSGMFLAVFVLALDADSDPATARALIGFVGPGIAAFMMVHQAFQHSAALLVMDKTEGVIQDFLMAPLSSLEVMAGYVVSAVATALLIGAMVLGLVMLAGGFAIEQPLALLGFALLGAALFAVVGALVGLWADKWEQYSAAESFLILPLGVMSGAFFRVDELAPSWRWAIAANPVHHVVEGIRWSALGGTTGSPLLAAGLVAALTALLGALTWRLFVTGYHIRP